MSLRKGHFLQTATILLAAPLACLCLPDPRQIVLDSIPNILEMFLVSMCQDAISIIIVVFCVEVQFDVTL